MAATIEPEKQTLLNHHKEKHFTAGEIVRDIIIGVSDGLTVPFALAAGLSGANATSSIVLTAGIAEVAAGAISMGLGGYLAAKSEADNYARELKREQDEIIAVPDTEAAEVAEILAQYGIEPHEYAPVVNALRKKPQAWLDFMMKFELGLEKPDPKRALYSALTIAVSYILGGLVPLSPYMFFPRVTHIENRVQGGRKEELDYERTVASTYLEVKERKPTYMVDKVQPTRSNGKSGGSESQPPVYSSTMDRPKLDLHSRTKQVESLEMHVASPKQGYNQLSESAHGHVETIGGMHRNVNPRKSDLAATDDGNHAIERPKLNLKPRSQPPEQLEVNSERGRTSLFGGARPRELVLKERGIDDVAINNHAINDHDVGQNSDRIKHNIPKTERAPAPSILTRQSGRTENLPLDQRTVRKFERKDNRVDIERVDTQRGNWRNENRRNIRGTEKEQQQQQERQPSPETWRKPLEQAKPAAADSASARHGKVASAVELAQAFSRSFSDPKSDIRHSGQRGPSSRTQVPFSRLMGPTTRPQINGY